MLPPERSEKQIAASRTNGAKSRGPTTPEGKRHSAMHTSRAVMLARTILLTGESRERFNDLYMAFMDDLLPASPVELALVEKMIVVHWKHMRAWAFEQATLTALAHPPGSEPAPDDDGHNLDRHALSFINPAFSSKRVHRSESDYDRVFSRCLNQLMKLRAARALVEKNQGEILGSD